MMMVIESGAKDLQVRIKKMEEEVARLKHRVGRVSRGVGARLVSR